MGWSLYQIQVNWTLSVVLDAYPSIYGVSSATAEESTERGNGSSFSEGSNAGSVTGVLAGVALIGTLIYFLFFRNTGGLLPLGFGFFDRDLSSSLILFRASEPHLAENTSSAPSQSQTCLDSSPNKTDDVSYVLLNFSAQNTMAQSQPSTDSIYSEIQEK